MKFRIADIQPNPFRHMDRYPIRSDKVESLRESIRTTEFWDNIVARVRDGKPQIAYGHHRLVALREELPPDAEVELIIRDLDDEQMIKIMSRENMEEWGSSVVVEHETVRAVVEAYAKGQVKLSVPAPNTPHLRYAPSFRVGLSGPQGLSYSGQSVADFLGWTNANGLPQGRVHDALNALSLIEEGILTESDFNGLGSEQASATISQAQRVKREHEVQARLAEENAERQRKAAEAAEKRRIQAEEERQRREEQATQAREEAIRAQRRSQAAAAARAAERAELERKIAAERQEAALRKAQEERERGKEGAQRVGRHIGRKIRNGEIGYKDAAAAAREVREQKDVPPPDIDPFAMKLAANILRTLDPDYDNRARELDKLVKYRSYMSPDSLRELVLVMDAIAERANKYRELLQMPETPDILVEVIPELISGAV